MMGGMGMPGGMGGFPGMGGFGAGAGAADTRPPREKYANELQQVKEMGFNDEETILQMLAEPNGNVNLAIERLFAHLG